MRKNETIQKIENWLQDSQTKLFEKFGVGFAFGNEQLENYVNSQRAKGYEGKFVHVMSGMYARKDNADEMIEELNKLHKEYKVRKRAAWTMDKCIEYELSNHECYYTGNWLDELMTDAVRFFFPEAKDEDFHRVYLATINNH